ncbi:MAG: hypothetical protein FJ206_09570 [Gemmatimonadetes bacterium]|nr:hypothetical protein [Gemmatimonadota bacterium]
MIGICLTVIWLGWGPPSHSPDGLTGATYARSVPLFPGALLEAVEGQQFYDEPAGPLRFVATSWSFAVSGPMTGVTDFYRNRLPIPPTEHDDGSLVWRWTPPGAANGEAVVVRVGLGRVRIDEVVRALSRT